MVNVTIGGTTMRYPLGTQYADIVKDYESSAKYPIILVRANGKLRELHKRVKKDITLEFVTIQDPAGHKAYLRSAYMILGKAFTGVVGKENLKRLEIHYSLADAYFFTVEMTEPLTQELLDRVKEEMQKIINQELPIYKKSVSTDEARERFRESGMYDKEKLFRYRRSSRVNIYSIEDYEDYYYGYMANHTGYIKHFELSLYDDGFLLNLPNRKTPDQLSPLVPMNKIYQMMKETEEWGEKIGISNVGELNERIMKSEIQDIILIQEALQEAKISKIAEQIIDENKKFVMIAGPSSSGKTSFANRTCVQLAAHGMKPHLISLDDYFVNREDTPLDEFGQKNYECLEALDIEKFNKDMLDLLKGMRVEIPSFNFKTGQREYHGHFLQMGPDDVLVLEGIHGLNEKLSYALPKESKFKIYISALTQLNIDEHNRIPSTDGRLLRRMTRDARTRGTSVKQTISMWPSVRRGEEENIFVFQENADVMFNSSLVYELACLKVYIEPLLFAIEKDEPEYEEAKRLLKFLDYFLPVPSDAIPNNSLVREFVGGSCFKV